MADSKSVHTINDLLTAGEVWLPGSGAATTTDQCKESYENLIRFYNQALLQLSASQRIDLQEHDWSTQKNEMFAQGSTLPRILDKYLWMEGKSS
jgi:hypothetical protein